MPLNNLRMFSSVPSLEKIRLLVTEFVIFETRLLVTEFLSNAFLCPM